MRKPAAAILCTAAMALFAASLFLPAFMCAHSKGFPGYVVLVIGFIDPRWLGNIGFVLLLVASLRGSPYKRPRVALATAAVALASFAQSAGCEGGGGAPGLSTGLAIGGYLWVAALLASCAANQFVGQVPAAHSERANTAPKKQLP